MGEFASYSGEQLKIGTMEDMYYLRLDQRQLVGRIRGNVDVNSDDVYSLRFRFPWPDEDDQPPGVVGHERFERSVALWGMTVPEGVDHHSIQFRNDAGYLCSLPCPEGPGPHPVKIHRNGWSGAVHLAQQKLLRDGRIVPVLRCGGCGGKWRVEEPNEIAAIAEWFLDEGEKKRNDSWYGEGDAKQFVGHEFWHKIASRILAGAKADKFVATV